jgi:hypothetical protein
MIYLVKGWNHWITGTLLSICIAGCGGGGSLPADLPTVVVPAGNNAIAVTVDRGPTGNSVNRLYTSVTICEPGSSSQCQTISHVLVDSGSTGLRLLASVIRPDLKLNRQLSPQGFPLLNCIQFVDNSFAWGPVATFDLKLGGKTASNLPTQLMGDSATAALSGNCATGLPLNSVASLGANGVLGLSLFKQDCGANCVLDPDNKYYFSCSTVNCTAAQGTVASLSQQLGNPVPRFSSDNNGFMLELPAVDPSGAVGLSGALVFGIGTQANNQYQAGSLLSTSNIGWITTVISGQRPAKSFLDTGANAMFFDSASIPLCPGSEPIRFYCPPTRINASASLIGVNRATAMVNFAIENALALFADPSKAALPTLAANLSPDLSPIELGFYWGLPFFYGRRVFWGIENETSPAGTGPFYAF